MSTTVLYEADGPVATVTLNRPENMNTMNNELLAAAVDVFERIASDDTIRAVIFTGSGRAFCAGGDLGGGAGGGAALRSVGRDTKLSGCNLPKICRRRP